MEISTLGEEERKDRTEMVRVPHTDSPLSTARSEDLERRRILKSSASDPLETTLGLS
jgi:hypothetical protein